MPAAPICRRRDRVAAAIGRGLGCLRSIDGVREHGIMHAPVRLVGARHPLLPSRSMTSKGITPSLARLLLEMPELLPVARFDHVWIFPPRVLGEVESGLVVLALRAEGEQESESEQREVVTVQYEVRSGKGAPPPLREVTGRGWAPSERVPRMIAGVVRRLGSEEEEPRTASIEGDVERWNRFVAEVSDGMVDRANGE